jgi:hypothetical protein
MRTSPEAIAGYSGALAAVLGGVRLSPLGVPHTKGKVQSNEIQLEIYFVCSSILTTCCYCDLRTPTSQVNYCNADISGCNIIQWMLIFYKESFFLSVGDI